jgi:hypothetical protein
MGPAMKPSDTDTPMEPSPLPTSWGGKASVTMAAPQEMVMAAPTACRARKKINCPMLPARAHADNPRVKTTIPARKILLRPIMSPIFPIMSMELVLTRTKATVTHITTDTSVSKTRVSTGKAMFVMLASMVAVMVVTATVMSTFHLF